MLRLRLLVLAACLTALPVCAQQNFDNVQIKAEHVAGNVHMLTGQGGNIGVSVGPDGILIIDDQFAPLADKIKAAIAGIDSGDLRFVLNTHWHGDHTGGNAIFGVDALIVAQTNVRRRLASEQTMRGQTIPAQPPVALPVITFDDSLAIHFNGEEVQLHHAPSGHTDGDSIIYFAGSNVLHMGDDFFSGRFPFVDLESGGSVQGLTENVGKVLAHLDDLPDGVKIIPGHGPLGERADLEEFHRMLKDTVATVQRGIDAGKSLDEIKTAGLGDEWKEWGAGFVNTDTWIQTIYTSLRR